MIKGVYISLFIFTVSPLFAQQIILKSDTKTGSTQAQPISSSKENTSKTAKKLFQPKQFKGLTNVIDTEHEVVMVGKLAPQGINIYEIALFGGYQKTLVQLDEDKAFLADCDKNFESRAEACNFFSKMGWQYLSEGSKEMATYRFNLASLLDHNKTDVYWGLGVIEYQKGEYEEAIKLMSQGMEVDKGRNVTLIVDLATVHIKCFAENEHTSDLPKAYELLDMAIALQPDFTNSYMQLALANLVNGKIDKAWLSFHKGYKTNPGAISTSILADLLSQKADPMGVFK